MKNKTIFLTLFVVVTALFFSINAFASPDYAFYPVSGIGSTSPVYEFNSDQTPFIYANLTNALPPEGFLIFKTNIDTNWKLGAALQDTVNVNGLQQAEFWFTSPNWSSIVQPGEWTVSGDATITDLFTKNTITRSPTTSFTVNAVPEPISSILFISGGSILAAKRLFRRRKS